LWALRWLFSKNGGRLAACYVAGIPLFWNTLAGDAFYATLLFGGMLSRTKVSGASRKPLTAIN